MKIIACGICGATMEEIEQKGRDEIEYSYDGCESNNEIWEYIHK